MVDARIPTGRRPRYWAQAIKALSESDAVLADIIEASRSEGLRRRSDAFTMLSRAIIGQQISVKAADSIWQRFADLCGGVTPDRVLAVGETKLREGGLTRQKAGYLVHLSEAARAGRLDAPDWSRLDDESIIEELVALKGIGRWTAEMFLIFHMQRPDVLPLGDLGLRRAINLRYAEGRTLSLDELNRIAAPWRPWRTVATWYLWRSLDPIPVEY
ncbi:MAG: DNA-3-methyladenine glycosylase 2 family protein [Alphaproteobacteria bacterium]|nr:DNA-3-methyladenine glycosylase 2 family protein [Alphaproteobacteria bacterium]